MKNDGPINNTSKIYGLIVQDSIQKVSSTLNNNRIGVRMNEDSYNIIETMTKCVFIYNMNTSIIDMAKPNQLVSHLSNINLNNKREFKMKFERNKVLEL